MRLSLPLFLSRWVVGVLGLALAVSAQAQQHRATRLGDPAHRFSTPLQKPADLRAMFANPKMRSDIASILDQAGWKGDVDDLIRAAKSAEIVAVKLPKGTRLPFMSSRNKGKPVTLIDVLWAGKDPIDAYEFEFVSKGWRYRCVTPKACANFLVVDLGPLKAVNLVRKVPATVSLCEPFDVGIEVRNTGGSALSNVQIMETLPSCLKATDSRTSMTFDVGTLQPGEARVFGYRAQALSAGSCAGVTRVTSAEGAVAEATSSVEVQAPVLSVTCAAPSEVLAKRPVEVCLTVKNTGNAMEPRAVVSLPVPSGATVGTVTAGGVINGESITWEIPSLANGAEKVVCASFVLAAPGSMTFAASVTGQCATTPVQSQCGTRVAGIPAILLEVVDVEDPIEVGQPVTYEIRVTNQGSSVGTNLKLVCSLPESQEFVSGSGPTEVQGQGRRATVSPLATLDPKAEAVWRVVVKAVAGDDARFKVEMTSDQFQRPVEEWEATSQY